MERKAISLRHLALAALAASLAAGCGGSSSSQAANSLVLDPTQPHYGKTYADWSVLWWQWIYELPETANSCIVPLQDPTGMNCAYHQTQGDVFFLAGTAGGKVVRNACTVPAGKALFFPIVNFSGDNAGVPPSMQMSNVALSDYVKNAIGMLPVSNLSAEFDGVAITDMARFKVPVTQYTYTLPPDPNVYDCEGSPGVTGKVDPSFEAGYYVMLGPPAPGSHTLHFAATSPASSSIVAVDVTYNFTVK